MKSNDSEIKAIEKAEEEEEKKANHTRNASFSMYSCSL